MRDGQYVYSGLASEMNTDQLIALIVGRELTNRFPKKISIPQEEILLSVENLKGMYGPTVTDASFSLRKGEILGISGLMGSSRMEVWSLSPGPATVEKRPATLRSIQPDGFCCVGIRTVMISLYLRSRMTVLCGRLERWGQGLRCASGSFREKKRYLQYIQ